MAKSLALKRADRRIKQLERGYDVLRTALRKAQKDADRLNNGDVLEVYSGNGRRQWAHSAQTWLYPGQSIMVIGN